LGLADPDSHKRKPLRKIGVHSASVCTRHGDELKIVNNGNEPWKQLFSFMWAFLDDDEDDILGNTLDKSRRS